MRFEGRDLKPYAEPVAENELKEGSVYFSVTYVDEDMHIPIVDTFVFIGRNLDEDDTCSVFFQDVESYQEGVRYGSIPNDSCANFFKCTKNETSNVFEFERALDELLRCSLRRKDSGIRK